MILFFLLAIFGNGQGWQALGCPLPPSENFLKETTWANNALRTEKIYEYGMRVPKRGIKIERGPWVHWFCVDEDEDEDKYKSCEVSQKPTYDIV